MTSEYDSAASDSAAPKVSPVMTRTRTFLFAVTGGAAVANLYWAQPLLDFIARDLHASTGAAGWLVTATQLGYALGVLLLVPLGDIVDRRRLIVIMMVSSAVALILCAVAPTLSLLLVAVTLVGLTTVTGQILTPLAGDLSDDATRGRVIGTVASGLLTGILVSRTLSGLVAGALGWRAIFAAAAVLILVLAALLFRSLPALAPKARMPYPALLRSVGTVIRRERTLRWTLALSATSFGLFTLFWTSLTFLLSAPPFNFPVTVIGLFGLAGLAGAVAAQRAGRLHDRGLSIPATGIAWVMVILAFGVAALADSSVVLLLVAIVILDIAIQAINILNQMRAFAISSNERSRLNTAVVTSNFLGGALGSAAASILWSTGGWHAVTLAGAVIAALALAIWAVGRRGPLISS